MVARDRKVAHGQLKRPAKSVIKQQARIGAQEQLKLLTCAHLRVCSTQSSAETFMAFVYYSLYLWLFALGERAITGRLANLSDVTCYAGTACP